VLVEVAGVHDPSGQHTQPGVPSEGVQSHTSPRVSLSRREQQTSVVAVVRVGLIVVVVVDEDSHARGWHSRSTSNPAHSATQSFSKVSPLQQCGQNRSITHGHSFVEEVGDSEVVVVLSQIFPNKSSSSPTTNSTLLHINVFASPLLGAHVPSGQHTQPSRHTFTVRSLNGQQTSLEADVEVDVVVSSVLRVLLVDVEVVVVVVSPLVVRGVVVVVVVEVSHIFPNSSAPTTNSSLPQRNEVVKVPVLDCEVLPITHVPSGQQLHGADAVHTFTISAIEQHTSLVEVLDNVVEVDVEVEVVVVVVSSPFVVRGALVVVVVVVDSHCPGEQNGLEMSIPSHFTPHSLGSVRP